MRTEIQLRFGQLRWSLEATVLAALCLVLFVATTAGTALIVVSVGLPLVLGTVWLVRPIADLHRRRIPGIDAGEPIASPYLRAPTGGMLARARVLFLDPARRRDVYWLLVNGTVGLGLASIGIVEAVLDVLFWWLPPGMALRAHAAIGRSLLSTSEKSRLALRVQALTESRAETVDTQAAELRRIERDLHDGAQARIVALGMSLAMAEEEFDRAPQLARGLIAEARVTSSQALAELRDLVRGVHPPVLADRGLVGAVRALALSSPLPVSVDIDVPGRLPAPAESAAYFAVAEVLANAIKHSGAAHVEVEIRHEHDALSLRVRDDGRGGADPSKGTGLQGVTRRLSAFDGALAVTSPAGGPTEVAMVLPCASSLPKTSPSSGTA